MMAGKPEIPMCFGLCLVTKKPQLPVLDRLLGVARVPHSSLSKKYGIQ